MKLPRVLIFGQPFNRFSGGGITLSNLFDGWDKDKIAVASTGHLLNYSTTDICDTYYQLGNREYQWIFPFNLIQRSYISGIIKINNTKVDGIKSTKKPILRKWIITNFFYPLLKYFGLFHGISSMKLSPEFCSWLKDFKPDILYVQISEREGILFAQELQSHLKIPMIIHNMDDWPSTISTKGLLNKYWDKKIDKEFKELLSHATLLMSISDEMAHEYKRRYGKTSLTFHNPIDIEFWKKYQKSDYTLNNPPTILYAGRIGLGINSSLELIAKAIQKVNDELGWEIKFILQTQEKALWFEKYDCIIHKSFIPYSDLPKTFSKADLLILPYDFTPESIKFIQFSMPTKVPEYMISGTPILIFAPKMTAIAKYAQSYNWAMTATESDYKDLAIKIKILLLEKKTREVISQNAIQIAVSNHNSIIINRNFRETICALTNK